MKYTNGEITVTWQPKICQHSGNCVRNLKSVFNNSRVPWIVMSNATTDEIISAVNKCPSGALSFKYNAENDADGKTSDENEVKE